MINELRNCLPLMPDSNGKMINELLLVGGRFCSWFKSQLRKKFIYHKNFKISEEVGFVSVVKHPCCGTTPIIYMTSHQFICTRCNAPSI